MTAGPLTATDFADAMEALHLHPLPERMAVAVSGGADSMALALLTAEWAAGRDITLFTFTVDHRLRKESAKEAACVGQWLQSRGIRHHILTWEHADKPTANLQAQARAARYELLGEACRERDIEHLFLGHHLEDQAETFLIRLQRGSGVDGLAAMRNVTRQDGLTLCRPLLEFPKSSLLATLALAGQDWVDDPSNLATKHLRVRMRQASAGLGELGLTPRVLSDTAQRMARASDFLRQETRRARAACLTLHDEGYISLRLSLLKALHEEIGLRVLADVLRIMNGDAHRPRLSELEALYHALPDTRTLGGCRFMPQKEHVLVCREAALVGGDIELQAGQRLVWDGRFEIVARQPMHVGALAGHAPDEHAIRSIPKQVIPTLPARLDLEKPASLLHMGNDGAEACEIRAFPFVRSEWL